MKLLRLAVALLVLGTAWVATRHTILTAKGPVTEAEIRQMPLIDVHCHGSLGGKLAFQINDLVAVQRQEHMRYVLMIIHNTPVEIAAVRQNKDMLGALLWVDPKEKDYLAKLEQFARENRDILRGFKLHPTGAAFDIKPELLDGLFALANREHLIIVTHTDNGRSKAGQYRPLLDKYPDTRLILYHSSPAAEAFELANTFPNVYIDVSFLAWGKTFQQAALRAIGSKKILFGIDSPLAFPMQDGKPGPHYRAAAMEVAAFYDNDREVVQDVFYRNAERLLKDVAGGR